MGRLLDTVFGWSLGGELMPISVRNNEDLSKLDPILLTFIEGNCCTFGEILASSTYGERLAISFAYIPFWMASRNRYK